MSLIPSYLWPALLLAVSVTEASLYAQAAAPVDGEHLFAANCAACHGSDGHGGERAPSIATLRSVMSLNDSELETIVAKGLPSLGMPGFGYLGDAKVREVVSYLRVLQGKGPATKISGDPGNGQSLFYGKAQCSKCHMVDGKGGFIAADLSTYGDNLSPHAVRQAIIDPDRELEPSSRIAEVYTADGRHMEGLLRSEDNFTVYLQTVDGRYHTLSKSTLKGVRHTGRSIMPEDYEASLSGKELDDLVSFLISTASNPHLPEHPVKKGEE